MTFDVDIWLLFHLDPLRSSSKTRVIRVHGHKSSGVAEIADRGVARVEKIP